ncbi:hypothetical protein [Nocardiopsis sp. LOL_012]|uniref:hypothetical protein n=1 Tax=Nocardiopsis sp. LOL_012 TaxID=3345409 RepID=UPI003A8387D6
MTVDLNVLLSLNRSTMTEYNQSPEKKEGPDSRRGIFGLGKLTNEEIVDLGRGLVMSNEFYDAVLDENPLSSRGFHSLDVVFLNDLSDLADEDPLRAEDLIWAFKEHGTPEALDMAVMFAPKVGEANYPLARSVIIKGELSDDTGTAETAMQAAAEFAANLPPDLREDFQSHRRAAKESQELQ